MKWLAFLCLAAVLSVAQGCGRGSDKGVRTPLPTDGYRALPVVNLQADVTASDRRNARAFWDVYRRASAARQSAQWQDAVTLYRQAIELNPTHWDSLYYLGNSLSELGLFDEALVAYRKLAASDRQAARAFSALGALYATPAAGKLFDLAEAERMYAKAQRSNGDESGSVLRLGEVTLAAGKWAAAADYLEAAGRTNFKSVTARYLQGYLAWRSGDRPRAADKFRAAIQLTKDQSPPKGVLGEGDTKLPAQRAMVRPGSRFLFEELTTDLWTNHDTSAGRMNASYRKVDSFLASLTKRGAIARR